MSLYFVTGIAGTGKSSLCEELKSRGYEAYDTDDDGFSKWQHRETDYVHPKSSVKSKDRTEEFLKNHAWNIPRQEVESLAKRAADKPIFLCGVADNVSDLSALFNNVFALSIDKKTLKHRLQTRTNNDWGKQAHELQSTLDQHSLSAAYYEKNGYIIIDANQPVATIADKLLAEVL